MDKLNKADFNKLMDNDEVPKVNQNHIILGFFEFERHPDKISADLGLKPLDTGIRGEEYFIGRSKKIAKIHEYNSWTFEHKIYSNEFIGDLVDKFINDVLIPRLAKIKLLSKDCNVQLRIVQYYYDGCNPGFYFSREQTRILSEINSSLDIDLYCLGK